MPQSNAAPSSSAHSDAVPSVGIRIVHDAAEQAERHSEPLAPARDKARAKRNARDRLVPVFKAIASIQAKQIGTGSHVHPGSLGSVGGFAFVHRSLLPKQHALQEPRCFKIESKSCLEGNFGQSQLASRSSEAVHGQRSEIAKSRSKQIAVKSSKPDPLGSLPVCPKSGRSGGNVRGRAFVILNTVQRVSNSVSKSGTLKGFMSHKIAKCSPATCLNTRPDS